MEEEVGEARQADSALHIGEWPFRRLLEKLPAGAYTCDPEGGARFISPCRRHPVAIGDALTAQVSPAAS